MKSKIIISLLLSLFIFNNELRSDTRKYIAINKYHNGEFSKSYIGEEDFIVEYDLVHKNNNNTLSSVKIRYSILDVIYSYSYKKDSKTYYIYTDLLGVRTNRTIIHYNKWFKNFDVIIEDSNGEVQYIAKDVNLKDNRISFRNVNDNYFILYKIIENNYIQYKFKIDKMDRTDFENEVMLISILSLPHHLSELFNY